jgi:hypothetical protein
MRCRTSTNPDLVLRAHWLATKVFTLEAVSQNGCRQGGRRSGSASWFRAADDESPGLAPRWIRLSGPSIRVLVTPPLCCSTRSAYRGFLGSGVLCANPRDAATSLALNRTLYGIQIRVLALQLGARGETPLRLRPHIIVAVSMANLMRHEMDLLAVNLAMPQQTCPRVRWQWNELCYQLRLSAWRDGQSCVTNVYAGTADQHRADFRDEIRSCADLRRRSPIVRCIASGGRAHRQKHGLCFRRLILARGMRPHDSAWSMRRSRQAARRETAHHGRPGQIYPEWYTAKWVCF